MTKILNSFFFSKKKLLLAFEYGVTLREVVGEKLNAEMVNRAEDIILAEFSNKKPEKLAVEMIPNLLACIEPK